MTGCQRLGLGTDTAHYRPAAVGVNVQSAVCGIRSQSSRGTQALSGSASGAETVRPEIRAQVIPQVRLQVLQPERLRVLEPVRLQVPQQIRLPVLSRVLLQATQRARL